MSSLPSSAVSGKNYFINNPVFVKFKKKFDWKTLKSAEVLKSAHVNERIIEVPFVLQSLAGLARGSRVLDLGCTESALPLHLACLGYQVTGFDFRDYPYRHPNLKFVSGDLTKLPFADGEFDAVVAVSTIEHVGIGFYQDPQEVAAADKRGIAQARRVLKPGGIFVLTVPFGQKTVSTHQRVYDAGALTELLGSFTVAETRFFKSVNAPGQVNTWVEVDAKDAGVVDSSRKTQAVCLALCQKT